MTEVIGHEWKVLIVEDKEDIVRQLQEILQACTVTPNRIASDYCSNFKEAARRLKNEKFDLLILDLKDDAETEPDADESPAGLEIFEELKKTRFIPVIFYTALAHKVMSSKTSFVRVVEKTESILKVKEEVERVFETKLPSLVRQVEEMQRSYMWDFVDTHWKEFSTTNEKTDVAYLLARRLAIVLQGFAATLAETVGAAVDATPSESKVHPMMMYVRPPLGLHRLAGDIVFEKIGDDGQHWLVLTPSCDFAQSKANFAVLAKCESLSRQAEYLTWSRNHSGASATTKKKLQKLIIDNREGQQERYKFLPGTFFLPDLLVDFQQVRSIPVETLESFDAIASLDSPFAESVLARFSRYFGRLGTPDIDPNVVMSRLLQSLQSKTESDPG